MDMYLILTLAVLVPQGGYRPVDCLDTQCTADPADAKVGRWMTYATEAGGARITQTVKVVGKADDEWLVEQWTDTGALAYGFLFRVGADKKIKKAWSAAKGDNAWSPVGVKEAPKLAPGEVLKPDIRKSEESKETKARKLDCVRLDVTVAVQGKTYASISWYSKRVWKLYSSTEHGGLVAVEASGSKTVLDGTGEDAKPTLPLPK